MDAMHRTLNVITNVTIDNLMQGDFYNRFRFNQLNRIQTDKIHFASLILF